MDDQSSAAEGSQRREKFTSGSDSSTNPESETRPFGVAADRKRIADAFEQLVNLAVRYVDAVGSQSGSLLQALPPKALSLQDAARYIGVDLRTINHLIKVRKLSYIQHGDQRGRVILVADLDAFLEKHRKVNDMEMSLTKLSGEKRRA